MIKVLDCTTRDGGHQTNWSFDDSFVFDLMKKLNAYNVTYYEIGYRNHFDTDGKGRFYTSEPNFIEKFYSQKDNLQLGVMADISRFNAEDFVGAENDFIDFVRVACHPDRIGEAFDAAKNLYDKGYKVFVQLMDASNIDEAGYIELYKRCGDRFLESLYIADSYGKFSRSDVEILINKFRTLGYERISFHGHNKDIVLQNSIAAAESGAYSIDTTLGGAGRCGGNLNLDEFFSSFCNVNV